MSTIRLTKAFPSYLDKDKVNSSELWNKDILFSQGEMIHIIAPSGSGKTSLLHFLYGIRKDYEGSIRFNDMELKAEDADKIAAYRQKNVSCIFQDLKLFPHHTAFENIDVKRVLEPFHAKEKINEMAAKLGVEKKLGQTINTCSYGEQQRIAIIRALMQPFDFLLLDEPFSHLDENNREIAMQMMNAEANIRNASIVLADLKEITYFPYTRKINL